MELLGWAEQTAISRFVREDFFAYFVLLILHAWGMALLVGPGLMLALRGLGMARRILLARLPLLVPLMWLGAGLAALSGLGLLAGYPAKALTNWVFALKFVCLVAAALLTARILRPGRVEEPARLLAALAFALWLGGVASGKLLLYTNSMLLTTDAQFETAP